MKKTISFIALMLGLPLLMTNTMAMDKPMGQEPSSRKRSFSSLQENAVVPAPPSKRQCVESPVPTLPLDLWDTIYQIDEQNCHNLLSVCTGLYNYLRHLRTNVTLCRYISDLNLKMIAQSYPNLTIIELGSKCSHFKSNMAPESYHNNFQVNPGHSLPLLTNLQTLILNKEGDVTSEILSKITTLKHLELPLPKKSYIKIFHDIKTDGYSNLRRGISLLTQLETLGLGSVAFYDNDMPRLQFLKSIDLCHNNTITGVGMASMTNLTSLDLGDNEQVTEVSLLPLTNLTQLKLREKNFIDMNNLTALTQLKELIFSPIYFAHFNMEEVTESLKKTIPHLQIKRQS